jgi:hypothetical protein
MKKVITMFAAMVLLAAPAFADIETDLGLAIDVTGDAVPAGSYAKYITITTTQEFDLIAVMPAVSSVDLSSPYLKDFSPSGWKMLIDTADLAAAEGTPNTYWSGSIQRWTESFKIELLPSEDPLNRPHVGDAFLVAVWADPMGDPVGEWGYQYQCARIGFSAVGWQVEISQPNVWPITRDQLMTVPAPAAIGLGVLGLALVGWLKRRVG